MPSDVRKAVLRSGKSDLSGAQIAFFGGSFTAVDREYMVALLMEAQYTVNEFSMGGIRISTRPDKIDNEILAILKKYGVNSIELGAQSLNDEVLSANNRGHDADTVKRAAVLIKDCGFELGLQMMTGLYMDSPERAVETARGIIELSPETVRIYPTIALEGTYLAQLYYKGTYKPQELEEAVELCAELIPMFEKAGIRVIRVGLHAEEEIEKGMVAGPYHPAFRELCNSRIIYNKIISLIAQKVENTGEMSYNIKVSPKMLSAAIGQQKQNIKRFLDKGINLKFTPDKTIPLGELIIEEQKLT